MLLIIVIISFVLILLGNRQGLTRLWRTFGNLRRLMFGEKLNALFREKPAPSQFAVTWMRTSVISLIWMWGSMDFKKPWVCDCWDQLVSNMHSNSIPGCIVSVHRSNDSFRTSMNGSSTIISALYNFYFWRLVRNTVAWPCVFFSFNVQFWCRRNTIVYVPHWTPHFNRLRFVEIGWFACRFAFECCGLWYDFGEHEHRCTLRCARETGGQSVVRSTEGSFRCDSWIHLWQYVVEIGCRTKAVHPFARLW